MWTPPSWVPLLPSPTPPPPHLGSADGAGGREGREGAGAAGSSRAWEGAAVAGSAGGRSHGTEVSAGGPVASSAALGCLTCSVGRRRPRGASGEPSPLRGSGRLRLLRGEPGGPGHGLERGTPDSGQGPTEPRASDFDPFFCLTPRLGLQERNFFWLFFSPSSLILGTATPPVTSPHSWGRVTWPPRP